MTNAIEVKGLTKEFKNRIAVDHLDLEVKQGEIFALLGQNGAGKTTTIKMLTGLLTPTTGEAQVMQHSVIDDMEQIKPLINVSPQETAVASKLSVKENLEFIAMIYGSTKTEAREQTKIMLKKFGLRDRANEKAKTLSGGLQRKLSIAMALISKPAILFLDEPTLGLDVRAKRDLWLVIESLKGKMTVILTTHYLEEAEALADHIAIMDKGKLKIFGTVEKIKENTKTSSLEDAFLAVTEPEVEL
jgi:ABC-2 type transport system ATP-binding protein